MISPSVKTRLWALIIHLDSEGIDPQRWQSCDACFCHGGTAPAHIHFRSLCTLLHIDICMHVRNIEMHITVDKTPKL